MDVKVKTAYVGLKIDGVRSWLWFKPGSIKEEGGRVVATGGWGQGGAYTSLDVPASLVRGRIESDSMNVG